LFIISGEDEANIVQNDRNFFQHQPVPLFLQFFCYILERFWRCEIVCFPFYYAICITIAYVTTIPILHDCYLDVSTVSLLPWYELSTGVAPGWCWKKFLSFWNSRRIAETGATLIPPRNTWRWQLTFLPWYRYFNKKWQSNSCFMDSNIPLQYVSINNKII
jgi:hypothetical protein